MENTAKEIALKLLQINAIRLSPEDPFTWASGWKSPIYCDNRVSLSFPKIRSEIRDEIVKAVKESFETPDAIAGVATAGIPQGALVADALELPFLYVRSSPKDHGLGNQIEGRLDKGQRVVVIEDLISTGGSSLKAIKSLRDAGAEVLGIIAIFSYGFPVADENFKAEKVLAVALSNYSALLEAAFEKGMITADEQEVLKEWRRSPDTWSR